MSLEQDAQRVAEKLGLELVARDPFADATVQAILRGLSVEDALVETVRALCKAKSDLIRKAVELSIGGPVHLRVGDEGGA